MRGIEDSIVGGAEGLAHWIGLVRDRLPVHPHLAFESLAYLIGFLVYRLLRRRQGDFLDDDRRWSLVVAVVLGAAVGSKLLHHAAAPRELLDSWGNPAHLMGGKTIVGALLGGWLAVEWLKRRMGIERATGDLYVLPLCVGIAIGRVGCLVTGVDDATHGSPTELPWGIDLGDGVARHPVRLIEIGFVSLLGVALALRPRGREGSAFLLFLGSYLAFRFAVDFLKPVPRLLGLGGIQWACLAGVVAVVRTARRRRAADVPASISEAS